MHYKKIKSRKGYTLVETVVTIAILTIVSSMGIGIVANTLQNYSTASVIAKEQGDAELIETAIIDKAKKATEVYFLPADPAGSLGNVDKLLDSQMPVNANNGTYFLFNNNGQDIKSYDYDSPSSGAYSQEKGLTYKNIKKITFKILKVGSTDKDDLEADNTSNPDPVINKPDEDGFFVLTYKIEMKERYVLNGSVVLNGVAKDSGVSGLLPISNPGDPPPTETSEYVLGDTSKSTAIMFDFKKS